MPINSLNPGSSYRMQGGLWGMDTMERHTWYEGEDSCEELRKAPMPSILPLMSQVARSVWSDQTVGGRCSILKSVRHDLASVVHLTGGPAHQSRLPSRLLVEANSPQANESGQQVLAGLLAMQLIGAGYKVKHGDSVRMGYPASKPIIGTSNGFQGFGIGRVLLSGLDTRPTEVRKTTHFMEAVRGLAREYLWTHKLQFGEPVQLGASDQLAHRARLTLLVASPSKLQANPALVKGLLGKLDRFEKHGIDGNPNFSEGLVAEVAQLVESADQLLQG